MSRLVLLRHGESEWNRRNLFTGWVDVDLSPAGEAEAGEAGRLMARSSLAPDLLFTSVLTRAVRTAELALAQMGRGWIPVVRHWRLNERHYGALQGLDKKETARRYGDEQVRLWRRSYDVPPPPLERRPDGTVSGSGVLPDDTTLPDDVDPSALDVWADRRYAAVPRDQLPGSECLADVVARFLPYWHDAICPELHSGREVLIVAHGNSLRALIKHLESISDDDIPALEVPTGVPRVYEVDPADPCRVLSAEWLGDAAAVAAKAAAVAKQAG
ncbi:MAG TPA: 2,3-bisphosphoglycerate-dependent phosphoglycerate mutase [Acidimicrobiales bacterium]|nr:2,3-bisphosphoglycerate-dependent phosphoglycerate mutase [Acidimicrobiales bacterium]